MITNEYLGVLIGCFRMDLSLPFQHSTGVSHGVILFSLLLLTNVGWLF